MPRSKPEGLALSRTVRFRANEIELVDQFLAQNPLFDFSTLTRVALLRFIREPKLEILPVGLTSNIGQSVPTQESRRSQDV